MTTRHEDEIREHKEDLVRQHEKYSVGSSPAQHTAAMIREAKIETLCWVLKEQYEDS